MSRSERWAAHHRSGELIDLDTCVWNDRFSICTDLAFAVYIPTFLGWIVVPKIILRAGQGLRQIRIVKSRSLGPRTRCNVERSSAGLNGEIDWYLNAQRQGERRLLDWDGRNADLSHNFTVQVSNDCVGRDVQF